MTRRRAALRAALVVALWSTGWAGVARAQTDAAVRVALLATTSDDPLAGRIEAELRALGFQVERSAISPEQPIDEQVRAAIAGGARAAVVADGHRTDVWVAAAGADRAGLRQELEVEEASGLQSVLALRTVEFLRISLGLATPPPVMPVAAPVPPAAPTTPPARDLDLALDVSSGVLASAGRVAPFAILGASLRAHLGRLLGLELCGYAPLNSTEQTGGDSQSHTHTTVWLAGGGLLVAPRHPARRLSAEGGVGGLAAVTRSVGQATAPLHAGTRVGVGAAVYGRAAGRLRLGTAWALRLDLLAGWTIRRPVIQIDQEDVADWGRPFVAALGGGELRF
ncbi:MAG TPA: hypothetical protein VN962_03975 [Polyangia bacterium]|nr:hypothetical protein [Polyangia bacterium]